MLEDLELLEVAVPVPAALEPEVPVAERAGGAEERLDAGADRGASGGIGGFMHARAGDPITIKKWLLRHEGVRLTAD